MNNKFRITQIVLLVVGLAAWTLISAKLKEGGGLEYQPNVLQLKGSPYGRTLALAMRGPADVYWHRGEVHEDDECDHSGCDHEHGECEHENCEHDDCDHVDEADAAPAGGDSASDLEAMVNRLSEEHAEHEEHEHGDSNDDETPKEFTGLRSYLLDTIAGMRKAMHSRNNDRSEGRLHRAFVMAETEKRLKLSFQMDPTNIACYGSYFMFLAEALARVEGAKGEDAVIRHRRNAAADLAKFTFGYCLNYQDEAPAMITGAVAAHDYALIQLSGPDPDIEQVAEVLRVLDSCIGRYEAIRAEMIEHGSWENFFIHRREEMEKAYSLVLMLQKADHTVFQRLKDSGAAVPATAPEPGAATR